MTLRVKRLVLRVKQLALRVKHLTLRVKHLTLRVKHMTLRVKQWFMTPMAYHRQLATVSNVLPTPRSYQLSTDNGGKYRRNRRDIRDISPNDPKCVTNRSIVHTDITDKITPSASNINGSPAKQPSTSNGSIDTGHYVTGSGRIAKPLAKYE